MIKRRSWFIGVGMACAGCGGTSAVDAQHVRSAEDAITVARQEGADKNSQARVHLATAEQQYKAARSLMRERHNAEADWMLLRAQADAELAQALAQKDYEEQQAEQTVDQVRALVRASIASRQAPQE